MRNRNLSGLQIASWSAVGLAAGLVAGFALSEWVGGVNAPRLRRIATRVRAREGAPRPGRSAAAGARSVVAALRADARLSALPLEATAVGIGAVELHGWVPTRAARAHAGRVARAVPGIDSVVNRLLVRGEDDAGLPKDYLATDQSA